MKVAELVASRLSSCETMDFRTRFGVKHLGPAAALLAALVASWWLYDRGILTPDHMTRFAGDHPSSATVIFVAAYAVCVLAMLPTLPLNLAAGLLWGALLGGVLSTLGATAGAIAAFMAARSILGCPLADRSKNNFASWLQSEFDTKGWRLIAFLRLNPVLPTGFLNYFLGLTSVRMSTYAWSTAVFLLPPSIAVALIGHEMRTFVVGGPTAHILRTILCASAGVVLLLGTRYAARYLSHVRNQS